VKVGEKMMKASTYRDNGWCGVRCIDGYLEFPKQDRTQIAVKVWNHEIPVALHRHKYYEFALIIKGCCVHEYRGIQIPLVPGDVYMIEPGEMHGYDVQAPMHLINCQFFTGEFEEKFSGLPEDERELGFIRPGNEMWKKRWDEVVKYVSLQSSLLDKERQSREANMHKQGVIHLNIHERKEIEYLFQRLMKEQEDQDIGLDFMKSAYLQQILVTFQRIQKKRLALLNNYRNSKRDYIYEVVEYMEKHITERLDLQKLSKDVYWSEGYFRRVFKDIMGMSPIEYFNRMRIVKSLELREQEGLNFSEAAARVGIYDASYYNRLFKKVMGDSPRNFQGTTT